MRGKWIVAGLLFSAIVSLSCASGHKEPFPETQPLVRDISSVESRLASAVSSHDRLTMKAIGEVDYGAYKAPVWVVSFTPPKESKYNVFLCGGIHGNEPAGAEIMVETIELIAENQLRYDDVSFDIVPIVNPWGWSHDIRFNRDGTDVNRDFASFECQEARIIRDFMLGKKYDLIVDHHEDPDASGFYMYQYANPDIRLSRKSIEIVKGLGYPIEQNVNMVILRTKDGLINAPLWGLWYMELTRQLSMANYFRLNNSRRVYTVETPMRLAWEDRLSMHRKASGILLDSLRSDF